MTTNFGQAYQNDKQQLEMKYVCGVWKLNHMQFCYMEINHEVDSTVGDFLNAGLPMGKI